MKNSIIIPEDAELANFREIRIGNIAPNTLYRSSHPIKQNKQEKAITILAANARISSIINLCDTSSELNTKALFAPWYNRLLKNNRIIAVGMDFDHTSDNFREKLKKCLQFIINSEGPWLIHCYAGIDRTGFVSMVLQSFMGASLNEIIDDYLESFGGVFESSIYTESHKVDSQVVMKLLSAMDGSAVITDQNLQGIAENYLEKAIGLTTGETAQLKEKLSG